MKLSPTKLKSFAIEAQTGPFGSQFHSDEYVEGGIPVINPSNIRDGHLVANKTATVSIGTADRLKIHRFLAGDLVFSRRGELGRSAVISSREEGWLCGTGAIRVRVDQNALNSDFAGYVLQGAEIRSYFEKWAVGSTMGNLNTSIVLGAPIPNHSLQEQQRIADFLDAETGRIDQLRILQESMISRLDEREAAQLDIAIDELISRAGCIPLRRFLWSVDQGSSPQCEAVAATDDEWGVLKVSCLRPGVFIPEENKRLPDEVPPDASSEVQEGDLLITRANTPQLVGSTAVVRKVRRRLLLSDKIFRVRLTSGMSPDFVATVARGSRVRALCAAGSNGASQSMANIRFEEVKAWPLPAVDLDEQSKFVDHVSRRRKEIEALRPAIDRQLDLLAERRKALISAAVTGQFDVSTASGRTITEGISS